MSRAEIARRAAAEAIATAFLVTAVVGSGIMAERLSAGNAALALLANSIATGGALLALVLAFESISGAHLNPVVSGILAARGRLPWRAVPAYAGAQCAGGLAGTALAHAMFGLPVLAASQHARSGGAQWLAEGVAAFGLVVAILGCERSRPAFVGFAVAGYITAAYWFTSSTSFANPAVTIARAFTDTFAGIRPVDVPGFVVAQVLGGAAALAAWRGLVRDTSPANAEDTR